MIEQITNTLTEAQQCLKMATRCDELAEVLEAREWIDGERSQMYEIAALLNCYAGDLRSQASEFDRAEEAGAAAERASAFDTLPDDYETGDY